MDNYEINILRRSGNWKKVKPDDLVIDEMNNDLKDDSQQNNQNSQNDFLKNVIMVETIISRLESLEKERVKLKEELKIFEVKFNEKKLFAEDKINKISLEKGMIEKTLNIIKSLKSF